MQKLAHGLQIPITNSFLIIVFKACLQSYIKIMTIRMKRSTLQHKGAAMLCEKDMITTEARSALLVPQSTKQISPVKTQNNIGNIDKHYTNCGMTNHNVETCRKKEQTMVAIVEAT
jgi:hypothetical protein